MVLKCKKQKDIIAKQQTYQNKLLADSTSTAIKEININYYIELLLRLLLISISLKPFCK